MTERFNAVDAAEEHVHEYIKHTLGRLYENANNLRLGIWHPNWRSAEATVQAVNRALRQEAPDACGKYLFYIRYLGDTDQHDRYQVYQADDEVAE